MKKTSFLFVMLAIVLAMIAGTFSGTEATIFGVTYFSIYNLLGTLFINALMLIVIPLVSSSIISGINNIGKERNFKTIGLKTFLVFITTNLLAIMIGLLLVNIFKDALTSSAQSIFALKKAIMTTQNISIQTSGISEIILKIIPRNIFYALSNGEMMGIIFFSLLFGFALTKVEGSPHEVLKNFFNGLFQSMLNITYIIIKFLPLGVFFLVAKEFAEIGLKDTFKTLGFFMSIVLGGFAIQFFIVFPLLLRFVAKINPLSHIKNMGKALITAFSTCSSSATIPVSLDCLEEKAKVSHKVSSLVVPLGASLNLTASVIFVIITASFIASSYGIILSFPMQFTIFLLSFLTTLGVASVPSGCLITAMLVLRGLGIPPEGIGLVIAADRIIDMFRTVVNVYGVSVSAVLIAKLEEEELVLN